MKKQIALNSQKKREKKGVSDNLKLFLDTKSISVNTVCTCVFPVVSKILLLY